MAAKSCLSLAVLFRKSKHPSHRAGEHSEVSLDVLTTLHLHVNLQIHRISIRTASLMNKCVIENSKEC